MTTSQSAASIGFKRCAVCKIDLKGRFVYLDEKIEGLLGYTKEELFGKSFLEFLEETSQRLIEQLLAQRNHYETFFDTTTITVLGRSGDTLTVPVVVSLNFIAGNPVNYQLIINCGSGAVETVSEDRSSDSFRSFVTRLLEMDSIHDWKQLLSLLCRFVGARQVCLYVIADDALQPRAAASGEAFGEEVFRSVNEAGPLHQQVARAGEEYSFIDQDAVQRVIEQYGSAPSEFVTLLEGAGVSQYLVRFLFDENFDHQKAQVSIAQARLALQLIGRVMRSETTEAADSRALCDIRFTVGFLDSLGLAAFLTDFEGTVIGYNPVTLRLFAEENLEGSYLEVMEHIAQFNSPDLIRRIVDYVNSTPDEGGSADGLTLGVKTAPSSRSRLTVMRLGDEPDDLSGCFVFVPEVSVTRDSSVKDDVQMWQSVFDQLQQGVESAEATAHRLGHEFYNQLGDGGNASLTNLDTDMKRLGAVIRDLYRFVKLLGADEDKQVTDLNLVVAEQLEQLLSAGSGTPVKCSYKDLPKVKTHPKLLELAVHNLLSNCIKYNNEATIEIRIKARVRNDTCDIYISDNGFGIAAKHLAKVFDPLYRAPDKKVQGISGLGIGLTVTKNIIHVLGGDISISSEAGEGSVVTVSLPLE